MNNFFRSFFAALLALVVFSGIIIVISFVVFAALASSVTSAGKEVIIGEKAILVVDLSNHFAEIAPADPIGRFTGSGKNMPPSLTDMVRLIHHARNDNAVQGIYIKAENNNNNFGSSEELRNAILDFKLSGKLVYAYGNTISQKAYYVANAANKIYCNPTGGVEWIGLAMQMPFIKGTLEKLEVEPQIFYAGKFKSATEPLREKEMTAPNRIQSRELLHDIYQYFLLKTYETRKIDTVTLQRFADSNTVQFASAAFENKLIDGLKYDDEVKEELKTVLKLEKDAKLNFISAGKYAEAVAFKPTGSEKIAVIYAEGNILDGKGDRGQIGGETYKNHIRDARLDKSIKAIVLRINSGGGSAMASELMWREVYLAKKVKPVIVSFGDVAASGGYYMACAADSIFAQPNTITGSIGVFGIIPNMQKFFNNKLGVTFDEVTTSPNATLMTVTKPLTPIQKRFIQNQMDTIYHDFKFRVSEGRKKTMEYVDSIAQGRVWSGKKALQLGLVDRMGGLNDAIASAATKAGVKSYRLKEYPGEQSIREMIFGGTPDAVKEEALIKELGAEGYKTYLVIKNIKQFIGTAQARLPFEIIIE